jgi:hypothetical protein
VNVTHPSDPVVAAGSEHGPGGGMFDTDNVRLQYELPAMLNRMMNKPGSDGVPDIENVILPLPTFNVPAGVVMVIPFTIVLVYAAYEPPGLFTYE